MGTTSPGKRPAPGNPARETVVVIGAGATGRGHVAQLAAESGYRLVFLDKDRALCDALKKSGAYDVRLVSAQTRTAHVDGFRIFHTAEKEAFYQAFKDAGIVFTAVCPGNIPDAASYMREHFARWLKETSGGEFKNVLCCENMDHSSTTFGTLMKEGFPEDLKAALEARVGFADAMVARVVARPSDPLSLLGEEYSEWTADRTALRGPVSPAVRTLELVDSQVKYLRRKLYIHNAGHATFGYLGFLKGYRYIHEAGQDAELVDICARAIEESGWAIQKEYGFPVEVISAYRSALTEKCASPELPDEILRVVREPARKLGREERFFGPIGLMLQHGRTPEYLLYGVCAALLARIPADEQSARIEKLMKAKGPACLPEIVGGPVHPDVMARVASLLPEVRRRFGSGA
jgi:mannitol-1-phosphate 5-dehydrogenase